MADETPGTTPGEVIGHVEPDTGQGEAATPEIPEGVDALSDEQIQAAQERGGGDDAEGGDGGALDVSDVVAGGGDDAGDAEAAGDAGEAEAAAEDDAEAANDDDAEAAGADDTEGAAADEAGEDAPQITDPAAQVAPNTGEAG